MRIIFVDYNNIRQTVLTVPVLVILTCIGVLWILSATNDARNNICVTDKDVLRDEMHGPLEVAVSLYGVR